MIPATHNAMIGYIPPDHIPDVIVISILVVTLTLKALALRRQTVLGKSMARFNFVLSFAYFCVILGYFIDFFTTQTWRWTARIAVFVSAVDVIWQLKVIYGGWRDLWGEISFSFRDLLPFGLGRYTPIEGLKFHARRLRHREDSS